MLSPVFHPNIAPHAICVGDHWGAGESLESIVIRIGEMLAYQSYNVKSPLNGEAARWVEQNKHRIPLDPVNLLPEEDPNDPPAVANGSVAERQTPPTPPPAPPAQARPESAAKSAPGEASPAAPSRIEIRCPSCGASYRVSPDWIGKNVRCAKCEQRFACSAPGSQ
jgi:predicted Zn finger-like uncharacterized protein